MDDDNSHAAFNDDENADSPTSRQEDESADAIEMIEWVSPPSITVEVEASGHGHLEQTSSVLASCDIVEHEVSPSPSCFSYSPGSVTSASMTPSSTHAGRPSSVATLVSDREIISRVWSSTQSSHEVQTLDLSTAMKKTRRALKSLSALSDFENLTALDVSNNAVADLHGLEALLRLETLVLSRNHLKKVGAELFSLRSLRDLDLSGNFIAHIPKAVARLELLERLNLSGNSLSTLKEVDALSSLANLHVCNFSANPFCKLPTYRDYVVFKLAGLESLDAMPITGTARDKARRRFFDVVFAKDAQLREVGEAHESAQSRLRDAQSALEAENQRLKGELHVKSQLLQNKSRAWSDATERLLQLQQEIAMLNLERQQQHAALEKDIEAVEEIDLQDEEKVVGRYTRRLSQFRTVEDDLACPAYEDAQTISLSPALASPASSPQSTQPMRVRTASSIDTSTTPFYRASSSPGRLVSSPRHDVKSPSQRIWERQHRDFKDQVLSPSSKPPDTLGFLDAKSPTNKDVLIRQTQALQSCKQVLLKDIAKEEELLHSLKQQEKQFATQIESLETNIQACIDAAKADEQASLELPFSGPQPPRSTARRRDDAVLAKLEVLRSKLLLVEDREKEIEMAMVRKTKRVLETDVAAVLASMGMPLGSVAVTDSAFDKEIFALTNKLQLTIVQKEELQLEMARVMEMLRDQHRRPSVGEVAQSNGSQPTKPSSAGSSPRRRSSRSSGVVAEGGSEKDSSLAQSYKLLAELRQKHQDVADRIRVKEDLLASLVDELRDVEAELEHIGRLGLQYAGDSGITSPARRPRSASFDFHQEARMLLRLGSDKSSLKESNQSPDQRTKSVKPPRDTDQERSLAAQQRNASISDISNDNTNKTVSAGAVGEAVLPFKLQFKDLLTTEMLEEIKNEVFAKLSEQFAALTSGIGGTTESSAQQERRELHDAITTALDAHMKLAMDTYEKKKLTEERPMGDDSQANESHDEDHSSGQSGRQSVSSRSGRSHTKHREETSATAVPEEEDDAYWDHFTELSPMEAFYTMKYRFVKYHESLTRGSGPKSAASIAGTQRILRACERLDAARADCRTSPTTFIEVDPAGNNKSALKVLLMGARDLPTSHLRTKNLDPYVSLEIVYPDLKKRSKAGALDASVMPLAMQSFRSRTQKKTMYPVWDEEFDFSPVLSLNGYLHVRILNDRKLSREQIVGETRIPLRTLLHQRRMVEWYSLGITMPSSTTSRTRQSKVISKICGGAVRLQLQLSFSRVEKCKRVVDELVTKFLHEHNHLPPFVEPVDANRDGGQENPEQDDSDSSLPILGDADAEQQTNQQPTQQQQSWQSLSSVSNFPLSELETSLSAYGRWRTDDEHLDPSGIHQLTKEPATQFSTGGPNQLSTPAIYAGMMDAQMAVIEARTALKANASRMPSEYFPPERQETRILLDSPPPERQRRATASSRMSRSDQHYHAKSPYSRANHTMPASRPRLDRNKSSTLPGSRARRLPHEHISLQQQHQLQQQPPFRPKPVSSSRRDECFDEYSPYHPAFQFVDLFDGGNNEFVATRRRQSPTNSSAAHGHHHTLDRKTDLRIFKSPGFSRRQPSSGFPERYIGLDNQTCERLKRMFGRIDAGEVAARRPRPSR